MENFTNKNGNFQIYPTNIGFDQGNRDTNKDILGVNRLTKKNDLKDEGINQKVHDLDVEDVTSKISSSRDATWDAFRLCRVKGHPAIGPVPPMEPQLAMRRIAVQIIVRWKPRLLPGQASEKSRPCQLARPSRRCARAAAGLSGLLSSN